MIPYILSAFKSLVSLFFPVICGGCQTMLFDEEKGLCSTCRLSLPYLHTAEEQNKLLNKFGGRVQVDYIRSYVYFSKKSLVQRLIHQLKYHGMRDLGFQMGRWYGEELSHQADISLQADWLVPVPIHPRRRQQRGYNQSEWIADGLAGSMGVRIQADIMERTRFISSQTRKNRIDRWENVRHVFKVTKPELVQGKHIVIVDDVLTTGATLEACVTQLRAAGAATVGIITVAATR